MKEFYQPPFTMTEEITGLVIEIGELVGAVKVYETLRTNPMLRRANRIKTIYSSLAIEQNLASRPWLDGYFEILVCSLLGFPNKVIFLASTPQPSDSLACHCGKQTKLGLGNPGSCSVLSITFSQGGTALR